MLQLWDAVEADFARDYGIDLRERLDGMSWRRFSVLLRNLSPCGAAAARAAALRDGAAADDRQQAAAFFENALRWGENM